MLRIHIPSLRPLPGFGGIRRNQERELCEIVYSVALLEPRPWNCVIDDVRPFDVTSTSISLGQVKFLARQQYLYAGLSCHFFW